MTRRDLATIFAGHGKAGAGADGSSPIILYADIPFLAPLAEAIAAVSPELDCFVLAMNDAGHRHAYPGRVRFELADHDIGAYTRAADFLNVNAVDALSVQHEYGIFGGKAGSHLLTLLRELRMPIVTTNNGRANRSESEVPMSADAR